MPSYCRETGAGFCDYRAGKVFWCSTCGHAAARHSSLIQLSLKVWSLWTPCENNLVTWWFMIIGLPQNPGALSWTELCCCFLPPFLALFFFLSGVDILRCSEWWSGFSRHQIHVFLRVYTDNRIHFVRLHLRSLKRSKGITRGDSNDRI